jgi:hypothetical protein
MMGGFLLISLLVFACLSHRASVINQEMKNMPEDLFTQWESESDFSSIRGQIELDDLSMGDAAVWSHSHRMYLIGSNSISFPWFIPKDFPKDALSRQDRESFLTFIDEVNPMLKYSTGERWLFYFLRFIMPPAADAYHLSVRKAKFALL